MTDHSFILVLFRPFATEDCGPRSLQLLVLIDLGKDVRDILVFHLRRLEDRLDDRLVGEDHVVGERLLEGTLRRIGRLRGNTECRPKSVRCSSLLRFRKDTWRCGWVWCGGRGHGIHGQCGMRKSSDRVKKRRTVKPSYKYDLA